MVFPSILTMMDQIKICERVNLINKHLPLKGAIMEQRYAGIGRISEVTPRPYSPKTHW